MSAPNPYQTVILFEEAIAEYCGSKYAIAVESCTSALFLSLEYRNEKNRNTGPTFRQVTIPTKTYPGVAASIIHSGWRLKFKDFEWSGEYEISPLNIWDAALRFKRGMYHGGLQCLSFHARKLLPIGRGGMILTDDFDAVKWLRRARFDGRNPVPLQQDTIEIVGWNVYMQPEQAARGLMLLQALGDRELPDLRVEDQKYSDLSIQPAFKPYTV